MVKLIISIVGIFTKFEFHYNQEEGGTYGKGFQIGSKIEEAAYGGPSLGRATVNKNKNVRSSYTGNNVHTLVIDAPTLTQMRELKALATEIVKP